MKMQYETVIGLEVHVELASKSKIFCGCATAFGSPPNLHICPVCTGMPGSLPVLNKQVLEYAVSVGIAAGSTINRYSRFDRKNYFYPDNPQNYQISQLYLPICSGGGIEIETPCGPKRIGIHEIHMEEDAGKLIHEEEGDCTLVDYNRSGIPLIEIVSEPDIRTAEEGIAYLEKLRIIIQYLGASDCKLQEGSMRADVNLSVRPQGSGTLGTRTEMKNLNSFKAIARAIEGESERQIEILERGGRVIRETRRWDDDRKSSFVMRSKEDTQDYRYFPDPDLPPIVVSSQWLEELKGRQPEFRTEKIERYRREYGIPEYDIKIITASRHLAKLFEDTVAICGEPKKVSNWIMSDTLRLLNERNMDPEDIAFTPAHLAALIVMAECGEISGTIAGEVFKAVFDRNIDPAAYVEEKGLKIVKDEKLLRRTVTEVLAANPHSVEDYQNGKQKAIGFLVGQTMKAMQGKADPVLLNRILKELL